MSEALQPWLIVGGLFVVLGTGSRVQAIAATRGWIRPWVGRKFAHLGFGAAVLSSWVLFPEVPSSRWIAALAPVSTTLYFGLVGLGVIDDPGTVEGGSRSGTRAGLLGAPVAYSTVFAVITVLLWRESAAGVAALAFMTLGDGFAEVGGRTLRSPKLPWNVKKTVAGTATAFVFGWAGAMAAVALFTAAGFLTEPVAESALPLVAVAAAGALAESASAGEWDNITVPIACLAVGMLAGL